MASIHRLTTRYVPAEDRLRLCGEDREGHGRLLWMTHRLIDKLLPVLFDQIDAGAPSPDAPDPVKTNMLHVRQSLATASLKPSAEVAGPAEETGWVVRSVDVGRHDGGVRLRFKGDEGREASIEFSDVALHQWLGIVFSHYRKAGWAIAPWPTWFVDAEAPRRPENAVVH